MYMTGVRLAPTQKPVPLEKSTPRQYQLIGLRKCPFMIRRVNLPMSQGTEEQFCDCLGEQCSAFRIVSRHKIVTDGVEGTEAWCICLRMPGDRNVDYEVSVQYIEEGTNDSN